MSNQRGARARAGRVVLTVLGLVLLAGLGYGFFVFSMQENERPAELPDYSLVQPRRDTISATVNASGSIQPRDIVELDFATTGVVVQVPIDVGQQVDQGAVLARLDSREPQLSVEQAAAALAQAEANYEQLIADATPEEIAQAEAELAQSQGQLQQTQGAVSPQDINAAEAQLNQARANLADLQAGPAAYDVQAAQSSLDGARSNLQAQRDSLSATKTQAESRMQQAANTLRNVQTDYSQIYWDNREIERNASRDSDLLRRNREREEEALRAVEDAEADLEQARVAYEEAQQAEITGIQAAEADVRNAQANLDALLVGADEAEIAAAQAQVAEAEASLTNLTGAERAGSIAAASAGVAAAEARLAGVVAEPRPVDVAGALAQMQEAEIRLQQAQLDLSKVLLRTPLTGTVAEVNLTVGEGLDTTVPDVVVADLSSFFVDVLVDEIDVASLEVGQPVALTLDALPDLALSGEVARIAPLSTEESAVTSYDVRISIPEADPAVRPGMSATADIVVDRRTDVLVVPRRTVRLEDDRLLVDRVTDPALCAADPTTWPPLAELPLESVEVSTGLRNELVIEVRGDTLSSASCLYVEGFDPRVTPFGGGGRPGGERD